MSLHEATGAGPLPDEAVPATLPVGHGPAPSGEVISQPPGGGAGTAAAAAVGKAAASAKPSAYKADWTHYAAWCAQAGVASFPADPAAVGAYLASLAETHARSTVRRRLFE
jgi:hypothetical protein